MKKYIIPVIAAVAFYGIIQFALTTGALNQYYAINLYLMGINIILAVSLNLINGVTGQFSLGHAGFMGVGAYTSVVLTTYMHLPLIIGLVGGGIMAGLFGLLVGIPSLRLKGDYLAIATLGFQQIITVILNNVGYLGGASGISDIPTLSNWTWIFVVMILSVIFIRNFVFSTYGRNCMAIREDEVAAEAMGINTTKYKVMAFTIGAIFAGIAGVLYAHTFTFIQPSSFNFFKTFDILTMIVLGGLGSITGSIIAAVFLTLVYAVFQTLGAWRMVIYSIILIVVMIFRPQGLMGTKEFSLGMFGKKGVKGGIEVK